MASIVGPRTYDAFICHVSGLDGELAGHIRATLHRLNRGLFKLRACRTFVDKDNVAAGDLEKRLLGPLERSRHLIVLVRPELADPDRHWCVREIQHWKGRAGVPPPLLVLTAGSDLAWDPRTSRLRFKGGETLAPAIASAFSSEPNWVDLRRRGSDPVWQSRRFEREVARIAVPIHGLDSVDELVGEDQRQLRRRIRWRNAALATTVSLGLIAAIAGVRASRAQRAAELQLGRLLQEQGRLELLAGHPDRALPSLLRAESYLGESLQLDLLIANASRPARWLVGVFDTETGQPVEGAWGPKGKQVVTYGWDGMLRRWEVRQGILSGEVLAHGGEAIEGAEFAPDGRFVVTHSQNEVRVWDSALLNQGIAADVMGPLRPFRLGVRAASFLSDGLLEVRGRNLAVVYDLTIGEVLETRSLGSRAEALGSGPLARPPDSGGRLDPLGQPFERSFWSPDSTLMVTSDQAGGSTVWDMTHALPIGSLGSFTSSVEFSSQGDLFLTGHMDGVIRVWDIPESEVHLLEDEQKLRARLLSFSPDETRVAVASDEEAAILDLGSALPKRVPLPGSVEALALGWPEGEEPVLVLRTPEGLEIARISDGGLNTACTVPLDRDVQIREATLVDEARHVLVSFTSPEWLWRAWGVRECRTLPSLEPNPGSHRVHAGWASGLVAESPVSGEATFRVWDLTTGEVTCRFALRSHEPSRVLMGPGHSIVTSEWYGVMAGAGGTHRGGDSTVVVWDATTCDGVPLATDGASRVTMDSSGKRLATVGMNGEVWMLEGNEWARAFPLERYGGRAGTGGAITPDGAFVVGHDDYTVRVHDGRDGRLILDRVVLPYPDDLYRVVISSSAQHVLVLEGDEIIDRVLLRPDRPRGVLIDWASECWSNWEIEGAVLVPSPLPVEGCAESPIQH